MKVLMLNTFDQGGGAARAAMRLLKGLQALDIEPRMLVQFKSGVANEIICNQVPLRKALRRLKLFLGLLPVRRYANQAENNFSPAWVPDNLPPEIAGNNPDIIHLHWLCASFFSVETIGRLRRLGRPLVWTLHDSWAFTGGCHVPYDCTRYQERCGACPVLGSRYESDLSRKVWERKKMAWRDLNLTVVCPSHWLADCARSSSLFRYVRVEVIPNGLDTGTFQPRDKASARQLLGLPQDKKIILFGAVGGTSDPNKGFHLLQPALKTLGDKGLTETLAVVFGCSAPAVIPDLGMPVVFLGRLHDDASLTVAYSAADVFVAPSIQEAFCQTAAEAMACGTPVVAFAATGLLDVVEHQGCGYLAQAYSSDDLAHGIAWVLEDSDRHVELSCRARQKVEAEFALDLISRRYADLYRQVLESSRREQYG